MSDPIIKMIDIEKHFGSVIALAGVSLDVHAGECHCLLGDNGAGKSTFIKTMSGVHSPTSGEIYFEGAPLTFATPRAAIEAGIATVHQHLAMIPLMSVSRNFFMGNEPLKRKFGITFLDQETADRVTMEEMHKMGINLRGADQAVGTLSGGERQTVAIARAVYFGAKVLILDEPTSALDLSIQAQIIDLLRELRRKHDLSYLFISHDLKVVQALCHNVIVMQSGKVVEAGPTYEVLNRPQTDYTKRLVQAAFDVIA